MKKDLRNKVIVGSTSALLVSGCFVYTNHDYNTKRNTNVTAGLVEENNMPPSSTEKKFAPDNLEVMPDNLDTEVGLLDEINNLDEASNVASGSGIPSSGVKYSGVNNSRTGLRTDMRGTETEIRVPNFVGEKSSVGKVIKKSKGSIVEPIVLPVLPETVNVSNIRETPAKDFSNVAVAPLYRKLVPALIAPQQQQDAPQVDEDSTNLVSSVVEPGAVRKKRSLSSELLNVADSDLFDSEDSDVADSDLFDWEDSDVADSDLFDWEDSDVADSDSVGSAGFGSKILKNCNNMHEIKTKYRLYFPDDDDSCDIDSDEEFDYNYSNDGIDFECDFAKVMEHLLDTSEFVENSHSVTDIEKETMTNYWFQGVDEETKQTELFEAFYNKFVELNEVDNPTVKDHILDLWKDYSKKNPSKVIEMFYVVACEKQFNANNNELVELEAAVRETANTILNMSDEDSVLAEVGEGNKAENEEVVTPEEVDNLLTMMAGLSLQGVDNGNRLRIHKSLRDIFGALEADLLNEIKNKVTSTLSHQKSKPEVLAHSSKLSPIPNRRTHVAEEPVYANWDDISKKKTAGQTAKDETTNGLSDPSDNVSSSTTTVPSQNGFSSSGVGYASQSGVEFGEKTPALSLAERIKVSRNTLKKTKNLASVPQATLPSIYGSINENLNKLLSQNYICAEPVLNTASNEDVNDYDWIEEDHSTPVTALVDPGENELKSKPHAPEPEPRGNFAEPEYSNTHFPPVGERVPQPATAPPLPTAPPQNKPSASPQHVSQNTTPSYSEEQSFETLESLLKKHPQLQEIFQKYSKLFSLGKNFDKTKFIQACEAKNFSEAAEICQRAKKIRFKISNLEEEELLQYLVLSEHFPNLRDINMSNGELTSIPKKLFTNHKSLKNVDLSANKIIFTKEDRKFFENNLFNKGLHLNLDNQNIKEAEKPENKDNKHKIEKAIKTKNLQENPKPVITKKPTTTEQRETATPISANQSQIAQNTDAEQPAAEKVSNIYPDLSDVSEIGCLQKKPENDPVGKKTGQTDEINSAIVSDSTTPIFDSLNNTPSKSVARSGENVTEKTTISANGFDQTQPERGLFSLPKTELADNNF